MSDDSSIWRLFNINIRLLGFGATFAGTVAFITFGLGLPPIGDQPPIRNVAVMIAGALIALLGLGFLLLPSYRPDLGDSGLPFNPWRRPAGQRSWWTGDRRS